MANAAGTLRTTGIASGVSGSEVAAIASANVGIAWASDGCAAFVWGVTNLAGLPFFDAHSSPVDYTSGSNPTQPQDAGYVVPHLNPNAGSGTSDLSGDGWTAAWTGSSMATLKSQLQVGDVVRIYKFGNTAESSFLSGLAAAHSFVVVSVSGSNVQVVDNWSGAQIGKHSFDDLSSWTSSGNFQSAIVSRINTSFVSSNVPQDLKGWGIGDWSGIGTAPNNPPNTPTGHDQANVAAGAQLALSTLFTSLTDPDSGDSA